MLDFDVETNRRVSVRRESANPANFSSFPDFRFDQMLVDKIVNTKESF
jgi:hypothetical protein